MIKELMHDPIFLAGKSEVATKEDLQVAQELLDTFLQKGAISQAQYNKSFGDLRDLMGMHGVE